jgi:hypothetical protein
MSVQSQPFSAELDEVSFDQLPDVSEFGLVETIIFSQDRGTMRAFKHIDRPSPSSLNVNVRREVVVREYREAEGAVSVDGRHRKNIPKAKH